MAKIVNIESWSRKRLNPFNMKSNNPTDQIFREKLGDYASDAPMHLWDRIDQKRSTRRRAGLLFRRNWGAAILVLFMLGTAAYLWNEQGETEGEIVQNDVLNNEKNTEEVAEIQPVKKESEIDVNVNSQFENSSKESSVKNSILENKTKIKTEKPSLIKETNREIQSEINQTIAKKSTLLNPENEIKKINEPTVIESKEQTPKIQETTKIALQRNTDTDLNRLAFSDILIDYEKSSFEIPEPDIRGYKKFLKRKGDPKKGCPRIEKGKKFNVYLDALIGPDYALQNLRTKTPDAINYLRARELTESYRFAMSSGLRLSMLNRNGLALRTGFLYQQIAEKFDYYNGNEQHITITTIQNQDGTVTRDTSIEFGERFITTFNRFHVVDIPLQVGYEVHYGKWAYGVNAGVNFNILFRKKGDFLSPDLRPQTFTSGDPGAYPAFRKNLGLSFTGSINLNYELTDNLRILIEPHFKYFRNSFSKSEYVLDQQYFSVGLFTGVRMKF